MGIVCYKFNWKTRFMSLCVWGMIMLDLAQQSSYGAENYIRRPVVPKTWLCYYSSAPQPAIFSDFDLIVLDGYNPPPFPVHRSQGPVLLGYVSIGEVDTTGYLWPLVKGKPYLVRKNPHWHSWIVDPRDPQWQRLLFEIAIANVFRNGFDGVFLDTLDSAFSLSLGPDAKAFADVPEQLVQIIREIRKKWPDKYIALNRGLPILSKTAPHIDYLVVESLFSVYNWEKEVYEKIPDSQRAHLMDLIAVGKQANPDLVILTLDYAGPDQRDLIQSAIRFSRTHGFVPYVGTLFLDTVYNHSN